jgi:triacylglycerol lipase
MFLRIAIGVTATTVVFHALTSLLYHYERQRSGGPWAPTPANACVGAWIGDMCATLLAVFSWPLGWLGRAPRVRGGARPVVLVHGWSLNRASMAILAARLRRDGREAITINYPSMLADTGEKARGLSVRLRAIAKQAPDGRIDVVAHGLGGVAVRAAAKLHGLAPCLGNVVTLGAPHRGTALALLWCGAGLAQLRPGSRFLTDLAFEERLTSTHNVTAIASNVDTIVFPVDLAEYRGALNVTVENVGHHMMLYSGRVYALLKESIDLPPRATNP